MSFRPLSGSIAEEIWIYLLAAINTLTALAFGDAQRNEGVLRELMEVVGGSVVAAALEHWLAWFSPVGE